MKREQAMATMHMVNAEEGWGLSLHELERALDERTQAPQAASNGHQPNEGRRLSVVRASNVEPESVRFAWRPYLPLGAVSLLAGRGGLGKSTLTALLGADVTNGNLQGNLRGRPAHVLVASAEDSESNTLRPRFEVAGADLDRVGFVRVSYEDDGDLGLLSVGEDIDLLTKAVRQTRARLLVLDPLVSFLAGIDAHKDQQVRRALTPLVHMAAEERVAVLGVIHLNKTMATEFLHRVSGSVGFANMARSVIGLGSDHEDRLHLVHAKHNLSEAGESLACHVEQVTYRHGKSGIRTSKFVVDGPSDARPDELAGPAPSSEERTEREEVMAFLSAELADGPAPAQDAMRAAQDEVGCSVTTVHRAKRALGVVSRQERVGQSSRWVWQLPEDES